jgi:hypothetical protein
MGRAVEEIRKGALRFSRASVWMEKVSEEQYQKRCGWGRVTSESTVSRFLNGNKRHGRERVENRHIKPAFGGPNRADSNSSLE